MAAFKEVKISTTVQTPVDKLWEYWTEPRHITKWNYASEDWHCPYAENNLKEGGKFTYRMEAKDGSFGFDFGGIYDEVRWHEKIAYTLGDGRKVTTTFHDKGHATEVIVIFEAESSNPVEIQQQGWQAILNNFKKYAEQKNN